MRQTTVYRYSMSFKQHVIEQLEAGRFSSINEAKEHFGIRGDYTIQHWLRKYGRNHLCPKMDSQDQLLSTTRLPDIKKLFEIKNRGYNTL